ncbi:MAG: hypothetical protein GYA48_16555 [Chloroflexi bacterium]|nr:hypothetical protein [Chloroflexota bacterium]
MKKTARFARNADPKQRDALRVAGCLDIFKTVGTGAAGDDDHIGGGFLCAARFDQPRWHIRLCGRRWKGDVGQGWLKKQP